MSIQHYQRVLSLLPDVALIISSNGSILAVNPGAETFFNSSTFVNSSLYDLVKKDSHTNTKAYLRQCARSNQAVVGSIKLNESFQNQIFTSYGAVLEARTKDCEAIILLRMQAKQASNVRFLTLQKQIDDLNKEVSRRLQAETELKNQTNWFQVSLASIGDGVIITDEHSQVLFLNPVAERLTAWNVDQAINQAVTDIFTLVNEDTHEPIINLVQQAITEGSVKTNNINTLLINKYGERTNIETSAAPIILDEEVAGVIIVFHDISEKRGLEKELLARASRLELMNQRKNQFLTMLAHELRSPVSPISNATQLLKLKANQAGRIDEPLRVIERQINHLKRLIDDMLDVSRITSGKMNILKTKFNLVSLIESICRDYAEQFKRLGLACKTQINDSSIWVQADADRITQVVHNLFNNSLKFTPKGGKITITLSIQEANAVLNFKDTGIGIDESAVNDLFEPFTQAEQSLARSTGGLGLGLSLVKGIVDLHDGKINVSSEGLNRGTTINISLPLLHDQSNSTREQSPNKPTQLQSILLIEDDQDAANMMCQLLELMGHQVSWASTGPEGVIKAISEKPTLIICDIGLPGLDGFGVAEQIRRNAVTATIPLVALTGYGEAEFVARSIKAGFDRHITKPASLEDIQQALRVTR